MSIRDAIRGTVGSGSSRTSDSSDTRLSRLLSSAQAIERELWFVVIAAMLIDVTLTVHGRTIGLVELNPIARHALEVTGVLGLYGLKAVALGLGGCCRLLIPDRYTSLVPLGLALPSAVAVVANATTIALVTL
mgnify:CR=1 FL=1